MLSKSIVAGLLVMSLLFPFAGGGVAYAGNTSSHTCSVSGLGGYAKIKFRVAHWPGKRYVEGRAELVTWRPSSVAPWLNPRRSYGVMKENYRSGVYIRVTLGFVSSTTKCWVYKVGSSGLRVERS